MKNKTSYTINPTTIKPNLFKQAVKNMFANDAGILTSETTGIIGLNQLEEIIKQSCFATSVIFLDWVDDKYTRVKNNQNQEAWVNYNEVDVLVNGSDAHYTRLINDHGKTREQLWLEFLKEVYNLEP